MTAIDSQGNIEIVRGDTLELLFTDVRLNDAPFQWSGYMSEFIIKNGNVEVIRKTEISGIDLNVDGQITLTISSDEINTLAIKSYTYDWKFMIGENTETWFNNKKFKVTT
jgi:hypothetical protein